MNLGVEVVVVAGPSVVDMFKTNNYTHWYELNDNRWVASTKEATNIQRSDAGRIIEIHFSDDTKVLW